MDVSAMRMREATIAAGIWLTFGIGALGEVYVALTLQRPNRPGLAVLFALAVLSAALIILLPRERIVRSRLREPFFLAWSLLDFAMLVFGTLADGGTASPLVLVFFIPVVFSSMSYPLASVVLVGVVSVISFLAVALTAGGSSWAYQGAFAGALACTAAMSAWQAQNHKRQHKLLATASRTDPLTGCLNRRGFEERANAQIAAMQRRQRRGAVLVLDIDYFKPVNDTLGHAAGDELLCWVAQTLQRVVRPTDAVGRLGGDEFAVMLPELDAAQARDAVDRIAEALRERAPVSCGLAIFPDDGANLEYLCRSADVRLYASRRGRRVGARPASWAVEPSTSDAGARGTLAEPPTAPQAPGVAANLWRATLDAIPSRSTHAGAAGATTPPAELYDQIDASVICTDMQGKVIGWNGGAEALYGWTAEEAVGRNARELVVPDDASAAEQLVDQLSANGHWDGELLVRRKDRSLFTVYVRNRLVFDEAGDPAAIVGVAVDISARVAAETELAQSRDYAQAVTECMGEGLFTTDHDGRVTYVNRAAQTMLGQQGCGELVGKLVRTGDDGVLKPFADSAIGRALSTETTVRVEDDLLRVGDGRDLPVAYTASPYHTDDGLQGCVVIFQNISERKRREADKQRDLETLACINRVEEAILEDRFLLYAQPIIDLRSRQTVQHELLLRMCEADGRIVAPGEFLPVAEQYALIGEIDWWVIKRATQLAGEACPVQLNVSARSVCDPDVLEHIERSIEQCAVAPGLLVFEITETAIVVDEHAARTFAERVQALGCKVALDDFGTGYGSLTYLKQIPVDYLKIDIEFVRDLARNSASRHVVQALVALAKDFGVQTVGEGVEDAETLELLAQLGVDYAQGYHIARPEHFAERPGDRSQPPTIQARAVERPRSPSARQRLVGAGSSD
ncbi:MAG TPA: EAL domain-containing protein [Solirubrobacteraceae bacterium]|nr:EAL domain-containing protein [Solirubrobacteraceae bacterium]